MDTYIQNGLTALGDPTRLAIFEMMALDTPPPVAIDEAIELARRFSGEESVQFINGVLDAAKRDIESGSKTAP